MNVPARIDWTPYYLSKLPVKWQGGTGGCTAFAAAYAIELRAMIQGYPPVELSPRYILWWEQGGPSRPHTVGEGGSGYGALSTAQSRGVCRETLMPMPAYKGVDTTTLAYSTLTWAAVQTAPSAEAEADAPNHMVATLGTLGTYSTRDEMILKTKTAIANGFPVVFFLPPDHEMCAWGYDDVGLIGLDSRSQNGLPGFHIQWGNVGSIDGVVQNVRFANATMGTPLDPLNPPSVASQPPPLTGNAMTIATLQQLLAAMVPGSITAAQISLFQDAAAKLVADAVSTTPPVGSWTILYGDMSVYTTDDGTKWQAHAWDSYSKRMSIWCNGSSAAGIAPWTAYYPGSGNTVYVTKANGVWWMAMTATSQRYMAANEIPPGYV